MKILAFLSLLFLSGCSLGIPLQVECHTEHEECPSIVQVQDMVDLLGSYHDFDFSEEPLIVRWYDSDTIFDVGNPAAGFTKNKNDVTVRHSDVLLHELTHVFLIRTVGDGDPNHEQSPGAWTQHDNEIIEEAKIEAREIFSP